MRLAFLAACLELGSAANAVPPSEFCKSLVATTSLVDQSGKAIYLSVWIDPDTFSCGPVNADIKPFCDAAGAASGIEFAHRFPWLMQHCVKSRGSVSYMDVGEAWTGFRGLKRLVRLSGHIGRVVIDVKFVPNADDRGPSNIYGKYVVTIWRQSARTSKGR